MDLAVEYTMTRARNGWATQVSLVAVMSCHCQSHESLNSHERAKTNTQAHVQREMVMHRQIEFDTHRSKDFSTKRSPEKPARDGTGNLVPQVTR
jgi:hypothetical protein